MKRGAGHEERGGEWLVSELGDQLESVPGQHALAAQLFEVGVRLFNARAEPSARPQLHRYC
ncbi:MAG TPA: hypothetical protein VI197_04660 [Polyangiaceae bacterium]